MSLAESIVKRQIGGTEESTRLAAGVRLPDMGKGKRKHVERRPLGAHHIREWREHRGQTLEQLSRRIGMTASNLSKIERRDQAYTQPVLEALSEALRCTPCDLLMNQPAGVGERPAAPSGSMVESLAGKGRSEIVALISALTKVLASS